MLKLNSNYSDYTDETDDNYPEGKAVNASTSESYDGTPLLAEFMNDINASHIAMYEKAYGDRNGISGEPDNQKVSQFAEAVAKYTDDKVKAHADQRGLAQGVHGATAEASAGQIVSRDEYGRAQVAAPVEDNDIANKKWVLEAVYPVGSLYWSSKPTNPSQLFGGTWVQIKDKFVLAAGDTYKAGATGGSATVQLTESMLPAHKHSIGGSTGAEGSHTHGMQHYHDRGTMDIKGVFNGETDHGMIVYDRKVVNGAFYGCSLSDGSGTALITTRSSADSNNRYTMYQYLGFQASKNWSGKTSGSLADSTSGSTLAKTSTDKGASHSHSLPDNTGNVGNGKPFSILPPCTVKYCWERTS